MADDRPALVWYVSYGSNLHRARFLSYLRGGTMPGGKRADNGCRDPSPPLADEPLHLPYDLYFSGESRVWGGGVAFLDHEHRATAPRTTFARTFLITGEQFEDLVAQESKRSHAPVAWSTLVASGRATVGAERPGGRAAESGKRGPGRYDTLVIVGDRDGVPMVTFTHPEPMTANPPAAPAIGYLRMLAEGLRDCHGLSDTAIAEYLVTRPGARGAWTAEALLEALRTNPDENAQRRTTTSPTSEGRASHDDRDEASAEEPERRR